MIVYEATILVESETAKAAAIAAGLDRITEIPPGTYNTQDKTWWECSGEVDTIEIGEDMTAVVSIAEGDGILVCLDEETCRCQGGTLWREAAAGPRVPDHARFTPLWTAGAIRAAFGGLRLEEWAELLALESAIEGGIFGARNVRRRDWLRARLSRPQREAFEGWRKVRSVVFHPAVEAADG